MNVAQMKVAPKDREVVRREVRRAPHRHSRRRVVERLAEFHGVSLGTIYRIANLGGGDVILKQRRLKARRHLANIQRLATEGLVNPETMSEKHLAIAREMQRFPRRPI